MASLKMYYSSGSSLSSEFGKDPSESIGGIITTVEVVDIENNLFRSISQNAIGVGSKEYRIVFIKNTHATLPISNLELYHKVPNTTVELNPTALTPADGDEYIVPTGAIGEWADKDGMKATYVLATTSWTFGLAPLGSYRVGFVNPVDITLDEVVLSNSFVDTLDDVFTPPFGVSFVNVDSVDDTGMVTIGDGTLEAGGILAMVIERTVEKTILQNTLFSCPAEGVFNPENMIDELQSELIHFSYDI